MLHNCKINIRAIVLNENDKITLKLFLPPKKNTSTKLMDDLPIEVRAASNAIVCKVLYIFLIAKVFQRI